MNLKPKPVRFFSFVQQEVLPGAASRSGTFGIFDIPVPLYYPRNIQWSIIFQSEFKQK